MTERRRTFVDGLLGATGLRLRTTLAAFKLQRNVSFWVAIYSRVLAMVAILQTSMKDWSRLSAQSLEFMAVAFGWFAGSSGRIHGYE